jgi:hypothetical protein
MFGRILTPQWVTAEEHIYLCRSVWLFVAVNPICWGEPFTDHFAAAKSNRSPVERLPFECMMVLELMTR